MPTTNLRIITIVVLTIAADSVIALCTLAYCMVAGIKADPTLITAFVGLTGSLVGAITGMLVRTQPQATQGPTVSDPMPVQVENKGAKEAIPTEAI